MLKLLLPVDGSDSALNAVRHAVSLVQHGLRATFVLANVQSPATLYEMVTARDADMIDQVSMAAGHDALAAAEALLRAAGQEWVSEIRSGETAPVLAELIETHAVDGVVMGMGDPHDLAGGSLGPVSEWLAAHAAVPVTLVPVAIDPT